MPVEGLDVSNHQGSISWSDVAIAKPNIMFSFIKATQGTYFQDSYYKQNANGCLENGIIPGPYHYFDASIPGEQQAEFFYNTVRNGTGTGTKGLLQPAVDVEDTFNQNVPTLLSNLNKYLVHSKQLWGYDSIIYTYPYFWQRLLGNPPGFGNYPLWWAHYATAPGVLPLSWKVWSFWQYTSTGHVQGIKGVVDRNLWNGSIDNLQKFVMK